MAEVLTCDNGTRLLFDSPCPDTYAAVFVINTPIYDFTGVAHVAEHLLFRTSSSYPSPHNLFAAQALTPLSINASTQGDMTFVFAQMPRIEAHQFYFIEALQYLYAGILNQHYTTTDIRLEKDGVIRQELGFYEQQKNYRLAVKSWIDAPQNYTASEVATLCAGGFSTELASLSTQHILAYKQRWYTPENITLITNLSTPTQVQDILLACAQKEPLGQFTGAELDDLTPALTQRPPAVANYSKFSATINRLMTRYRHLDLPIFTREAPWIPPNFIHNLFDGSTRLSPPCDIMTVDPDQATLPESWLAAFPDGLVNLPPLPRYMQRQWTHFCNYRLTVNGSKDWYLGIPEHAVDPHILPNLIMDSRFWLPRTAGECYALGVARHGDQILLFGVNDKQVNYRQQWADWILLQLLG
ncbi:insulinase family protein [Alteromonas sp. C1M14]|uniref:insulinase family protein n=1 Tax=Alteromonas sp. C1M14 TaxID=2841567 RepID=UPI001C0825F6|nr:insulinase family protein [Alteromonas sp. C1M14]MBU2979265.1 insulinase family protein [Alteromonas sp. C1M14]